MKYGVLGEKLPHSFSPAIHKLLGNPEYGIIEVKKNKLEEFMLAKDFEAINVTIPYKQAVLPYLSEISDKAKRIGCVNVVVKRQDGSLVGDNTDYDGFKYLVEAAGIEIKGRKCLILGNGGTSLTVHTVLEDMGAYEIIKVSRSSEVNYDNIYEQRDTQVIVNTTPVGMYPDNQGKLIELEHFPKLEGVVDVIYNPLETVLVISARERGIKAIGGLHMLVAQAKYASDIFFGKDTDDSVIEEIYRSVRADMGNIAFVGMPGCGKSTLAEIIAEKTGKSFVDIDNIIEDLEGRSIPDIFALYGEKYFRNTELEACRIAGKKRSAVIAAGGGAVINKENVDSLRQNALIIYIRRDIEKLSRRDRPLSKDMDTLRLLYEERRERYEEAADYIVDNNGSLEECVDKIMELIKEV